MKVLRAIVCSCLCVSLIDFGACAEDKTPRGRRFELTCRFSTSNIPHQAGKVIAWVPIPPTNQIQNLAKSEIHDKLKSEVVHDTAYGNSFYRLDISDYPRNNGDVTTITVKYEVARLPMRAEVDAPLSDVTSATLSELLAPDDLVPITGKIKDEALLVAGQAKDKVETGRALFENVVKTMRYDKSGTGWGRGDALYACDSRTGNCSDFHSLFVGQSRALGVPAVFVAGLAIPTSSAGVINGYHCWAQFYVENRGWFPVDASEASKNPGRKDQLFGGLDADRIEMTVGRDLRLPGAKGESINFMVYPYVEVDGVAHSDVSCIYSYREIESNTSATASLDINEASPAASSKQAGF